MSYLDPKNSVTIIRGSTKIIEVTVTDDDSDPKDLTGGTMYFSVKKYLGDQVPVIQKSSADAQQIEFTYPRGGVARIYVTPADTQRLELRKFIFDVWFVDANADRFVVVEPSTFELEGSVTQLTL